MMCPPVAISSFCEWVFMADLPNACRTLAAPVAVPQLLP